MRLLGPGVELELAGRSLARKDGLVPRAIFQRLLERSFFRRCKDLASYLGLPTCEKREGQKGSPKPRRKDLSSYLGVGQDVLCTVVAPQPPPQPQQPREPQSAQADPSSPANRDNLQPQSPAPPRSSAPPPPTDASQASPSPASSVPTLPISTPHLPQRLHPPCQPSKTSLRLLPPSPPPPSPPPPSPPPMATLPPSTDIDMDYSWGTEVDSAFSSAASSEYSTIYL